MHLKKNLGASSKLLIITKTFLQDAECSMGPGSVNYSWSHPNGLQCFDLIFTSRAVKHIRYTIVPNFFSCNHWAIKLQAVLSIFFPISLGSWKLNCTLLQREKMGEDLKDDFIFQGRQMSV